MRQRPGSKKPCGGAASLVQAVSMLQVEGSTVKLYGSVRSWAEREIGRASRVVCIWDYNGQKPHYDQSVLKRSDHSYRNIFIRRHIGLL